MVAEIQPHDIGNMLYNMSTTTLTLTNTKKRWRRAFFTIKFSNTLLSTAKNIIQLIPQVVPEVRIDVKEASDHQFHGIDQSQLINIVHNKDLETLRRFDGVKGLAKTLHTHLDNGIKGQGLDERKAVFGTNSYEKPPLKGLLYFVAKASKNVTILVLMVCTVLSVGFGIKKDGIKDGWYEGGSILLAVLIVIVVSAVGNFRQEKQFDNLSKISNNIKIDVVREGRRQKVSIFDIVVGDIVVLNVGDQIPADGLFIDGRSLLVDESSMTGESEQIEVNAIINPFLISGAKVADGYCRMLVLSVGMNTAWGKMMSSIQGDNNEQTPLQSQVNKITFSIRKVGLAVAFLVLVAMLVCYFTGNTKEEDNKLVYNGKHTSVNKILDSVMGVFFAAVTITVVAIPEGLPLMVTLTLTYSLTRMIGDQAMVLKLFACEPMCSATILCTEKATETGRFVVVEIPSTTGDYDFTAKGIATECGILESGQEECEEEEEEEEEVVYNFTDEERMQKVDKISVMARSSPLMVKCSKQKGHVVVVTSDVTNDAPTLEEANIGLSIEIQETEVAKQSSDSVFSDEDVASLSTVVMLRRYNNIQKLIQFQLTVNVATLVINFITMVTSGGAPLTAVQLLRVNLIMDTLGALALATEGHIKEILTKPPVGRVKQIIIYIMSRHLFAQALFQITVLLTFEFKGEAIFNVEEKVKNTITFNTFVLCQVFNEFNSRKLKKRNIFIGIHKSKLFLGITRSAIIFEIMMVMFLENFWNRRRSYGVQWGITIAIATLSWSSQKVDAQNSVNAFLTTTIKSLKKMAERLRVSDELVKPLADLALMMSCCFDPLALETVEQVINAFKSVIEKQNDAVDALEAWTTLADTQVRSS